MAFKTFTNGDGDNLFENPLNWNGGTLPLAGDTVTIGNFTVSLNSPFT